MLSKEQKRQLASQAHHLKPVVMTGANGITDNLINEVNIALTAHELIKVKVSASDRKERAQMTEEICERTQSELINNIGHIAIIYRKNPEKD